MHAKVRWGPVAVALWVLAVAVPCMCRPASRGRRSMTHATISNDTLYPHEFAGLVDGSGRLPCIKYFVLRQTAEDCIQLTSQDPSVTAEVCSTPAGPLLAIYSPDSDRNVFTARVTGPQVVMLSLAACSVTQRVEKAAKPEGCDTVDPLHTSVMYSLMSGYLPGTYHLNVTWLYTHFSFGKGMVGVNRASMHAIEAAIEVSSPSPAARQVAAALLPNYNDCTYCESRRAVWPTCDAPSVSDGTWLLKQQGEQVSGSLPDGLQHHHDPDLIHWQPLGCHFKPTKEIDLRQCLADKHICFVGDSHTRHLNNALVDAVQHPDKPGALSEVGKKAVLKDKCCSFFWHPFGDNWVNKQLDKCTHILFNFGQWPLSYQPPSRWSVSHYLQELQERLRELRAYRKKHKDVQLYWVTTNYHTLEPKHWNCTGALDFRTQPFVELFNVASSDLMRLHGVPVLDTALLTSHVTELTVDGSHFPWPGSVGHYVTQYLANVLCVGGQQRH